MRQRWHTVLGCLLLLWLVTACAGTGPATTGGTDAPDVDTTPQPVATEEATDPDAQPTEVPSGGDSVSWDRSPDTVVLQLWEGGGFRMVAQATEPPQWTLFGDGTVIWTEEGVATPGFVLPVWTGTLSDAEIQALLKVVDEVDFWAISPGPGAVPPAGTPENELATDMFIADAPSSVITVNVSERQHSVTIYPGFEEAMPQSYRTLRQTLLGTKPANAQQVTPTAFSLQAYAFGPVVDLDEVSRERLVEWPFADIDLAQVVNEPMPLEGEKGMEIGRFLVANGYLIQQGDTAYNVSFFAEPPRSIPNPGQ